MDPSYQISIPLAEPNWDMHVLKQRFMLEFNDLLSNCNIFKPPLLKIPTQKKNHFDYMKPECKYTSSGDCQYARI